MSPGGRYPRHHEVDNAATRPWWLPGERAWKSVLYRYMDAHPNAQLAWNAAYWLLKSEARRQRDARFPDCDWKFVESNDECVAAVIEAQTRLCKEAMRRDGSDLRRRA